MQHTSHYLKWWDYCQCCCTREPVQAWSSSSGQSYTKCCLKTLLLCNLMYKIGILSVWWVPNGWASLGTSVFELDSKDANIHHCDQLERMNSLRGLLDFLQRWYGRTLMPVAFSECPISWYSHLWQQLRPYSHHYKNSNSWSFAYELSRA